MRVSDAEDFEGRMRVFLELVKCAGYEGHFQRMPDGFFEDDAVRLKAYQVLPEHVQKLVLTVGLAACFGAFADARSDAMAEQAKGKFSPKRALP